MSLCRRWSSAPIQRKHAHKLPEGGPAAGILPFLGSLRRSGAYISPAISDPYQEAWDTSRIGSDPLNLVTGADRENVALAAEIKAGDQTIGVFIRLSLKRERDLDFNHPVFIAELDLGKLRKFISAKSQIEDLPQFPGSSRDAAMELPIDTSNAQIEAVLKKALEPLLVSFGCFDLFTDPTSQKIAADRKSIAYRFIYRAPHKTLKQQEVDDTHRRVLDLLGKIPGLGFR